MKDFKQVLKEVVGEVTDDEVKVAYSKFLKSRNWDINHPVFIDGILKNEPCALNKRGFMRFFKSYQKFAKNKNNKHLKLELIR